MQRKDVWTSTFSGEKFHPFDPKVEEINIKDISHSLSNLCRFNGHVREFYSVAQHSVLCATISEITQYPKDYRLAILLHDASEAYVGDLVKPIKSALPDFEEIEKGIMVKVAEKFNLNPAYFSDGLLLEIDRRMAATEACCLLNEKNFERWQINPKTYRYPFEIKDCWCPTASKSEFMRLFKELTT